MRAFNDPLREYIRILLKDFQQHFAARPDNSGADEIALRALEEGKSVEEAAKEVSTDAGEIIAAEVITDAEPEPERGMVTTGLQSAPLGEGKKLTREKILNEVAELTNLYKKVLEDHSSHPDLVLRALQGIGASLTQLSKATGADKAEEPPPEDIPVYVGPERIPDLHKWEALVQTEVSQRMKEKAQMEIGGQQGTQEMLTDN